MLTRVLPDATATNCENFLDFFQDEVAAVVQVTGCNAAPDFSDAADASVVFEQSEPASLTTLTDVVQHMKLSNWPLDILPSKFLKTGLKTVGLMS